MQKINSLPVKGTLLQSVTTGDKAIVSSVNERTNTVTVRYITGEHNETTRELGLRYLISSPWRIVSDV